MLLGIIRQAIFYIPVMILLPMAIGVSDVYYGSFLIDVVIVIFCIFLVRKEFKNLRSKEKNLKNAVNK
ncbi:hypothetical protein AZF37_02995 [endosymbiont 'TC1' of Trimyema compressum]|nr:hypothetical protein AZF37_02995 [endosymbiont 'TC1' of Trimyema compressum]